ncbi:Membrane fusion protein (MFP) family protein [Azospirillaceae bacterium]
MLLNAMGQSLRSLASRCLFMRRAPKDDVTNAALNFLTDADEIEQRPLPPSMRSTLYLVVGLMITALLWASLSSIDRVVVARGKLMTTADTIVVQPLETAVVRSLDVKIGQIVTKGSRLASLDPTFATAEISVNRARMQGAQAQFRRVEAELAGAEPILKGNLPEEEHQIRLFKERRQAFIARMKQYEETLSRMSALIYSNVSEQKILEKRLTSLIDIERSYEELFQRKAGSRLKFIESREQRLSVERDFNNAVNHATELEKERAVVISERDSFQTQWRQEAAQELVTAHREMKAAQELLTKAERKKELIDLVTPADAVVLEIAKRSLGSVVKEAEPFFTLVPLDAPLEAEARIESRDIGFVRSGDMARIKLDAFPYQKHGALDAVVRMISEDAFNRDSKESTASDYGGESYYLTRFNFKSTTLSNVPTSTKLMPGMTLTAEIVVGKRSVISYFIYPLIRALDESIREP